MTYTVRNMFQFHVIIRHILMGCFVDRESPIIFKLTFYEISQWGAKDVDNNSNLCPLISILKAL